MQFAQLKPTLIALALAGVGAEASATELESINFKSGAGTQFEALMMFDTTAPSYTSYVIEKPAQIIIDLLDTENGLEQKRFPLELANAKSAVVRSDGERTRLVIKLRETDQYSLTEADGGLMLKVGGSKPAQSANHTQKVNKSVVKSDEPSQIDNLEFRSTDNGSGQIILQLSSDDAVISVDANHKNTKVKLEGVSPDTWAKKFDVSQFKTPVDIIDVKGVGDSTEIEIQSSDVITVSAFQANNQYVINVEPVVLDQHTGVGGKAAFKGERLSFNFQNIEVRSILQIIAEMAGLNLIASDSVQGSITLRLQDVPWDQALELVLRTQGLDKRMDGNVLLVAPAEELVARERMELESSRQIAELAPMKTVTYEMNYARASEIYDLFKQLGTNEAGAAKEGVSSERGSAVVYEPKNTIVMTDTLAKHAEFEGLLKKLDVPIRQVEIEARIVLASSDASRDLGVRWGFNYANDDVLGAGSMDGITQQNTGSDVSYGDAPGGLVVDLAAAPPAGTASSIAVGYLGDNGLLTLELSALEAEGKGEVISQPKVITGNQQMAMIQSGSEIPYQEATSSGATAVQFKEATLKLEVTPQITPDNRIIMTLDITKDAIGAIVEGIPTIDVTQLNTEVIANNGQTVVLGGIFEQTIVESETKTPFLGDIPVLGNLFKKKSKSNEKQETLIFITPRILESSVASQ